MLNGWLTLVTGVAGIALALTTFVILTQLTGLSPKK